MFGLFNIFSSGRRGRRGLPGRDHEHGRFTRHGHHGRRHPLHRSHSDYAESHPESDRAALPRHTVLAITQENLVPTTSCNGCDKQCPLAAPACRKGEALAARRFVNR